MRLPAWAGPAVALWLAAGCGGGAARPGDAFGSEPLGNVELTGDADAAADLDRPPSDTTPPPGDTPGPDDPLHLGSAATLEILTWNLHNFPSTDTTAAEVAALTLAMDVDLVALQEIADVTAFAQILAALPGYEGVTSPDQYSAGEYQKTGFLYRTDGLRLTRTESLFAGDDYAFPRPPLAGHFALQHEDGSETPLLVIVAHLKASPGETNEARRRAACAALKAHVDALLAQEPGSDVAIVGDLNDLLTDAPADNVFTVFTDDPEDYTILSAPLAAAGEFSYIPYRHLYDHLIAVRPFADRFFAEATAAVPLELTDLAFDYEEVISDHRPVVAVVPR
jgi:endonuclease/exonuclease/phosphatase family metal-dependent hydrolase